MLLTVPLLAVIAQATSTPDSTHRIVAEESFFGLVAYKAGFASMLVDNNLTYARKYTVQFVRGETPENVSFHLQLEAKSMAVNDPEEQTRWYPRFEKLGILDTPFKNTSERLRRRMSRTLLSDRLLDAEHHPYVEARTVSVTKDPRSPAGQNYWLGLEITIRDKTVRADWPAMIVREGEKIVVETHGRLKFTSFGIDPYSRLFGAIRYRDEFEVFAHMVAEPATMPRP